MRIKSLQKANNLLKALQDIDAEIKSISKYAKVIQAASLSIFLNLSHEKEVVETEAEENDGMGYPRFSFIFPVGLPVHQNIPKPKKEKLGLEITEVAALQVLGVMVAHKESERMSIIRQLTEMGFEVNL